MNLVKLEKDKILVSRIQNGDGAAFNELVREYEKRLFAVALGITGNSEQARDVVQETFLRAHLHLKGFTVTTSLFAWLRRVAVTQSLNFLRFRKRQRAEELDEDAAYVQTTCSDFYRGSFELLEGRRLAHQIKQALGELPEVQRDYLLQYAIDGMRYKEIAYEHNVPIETVSTRVFRARKKLREHLAAALGDGQT